MMGRALVRTWIYLVDAEPVGSGANITLKDGLNVTTVSNPESRDDQRHRDSPNIHGLIRQGSLAKL